MPYGTNFIDKEFRKKLGENMRKMRETASLSQGDIERRTGIMRCVLSRYENGHSAPSVQVFFRLAQAIGVSMNDLYSGQK